jgi:hypothetical protein
MKNASGTDVFKMQNGALEITGTIKASGGWFGNSDGWVIGGNVSTDTITFTTMDGVSHTETGSRI